MKINIVAILLSVFIISCKGGKSSNILPESIGKVNKILVVTQTDNWLGKVGDQIRTVFGQHVVGLPQPETLLSVSQVPPKGFLRIMKVNRSVLIVEKANKNSFSVTTDKYASPQTIIYLTGVNQKAITEQIKKYGKKIITIFKNADIEFLQRQFANKKFNIEKIKTLKKLGLSLTVPRNYKLVEDTGDFLWLRQHLMGGIARGDGTNNILVYSAPLIAEDSIADNLTDSIVAIRNRIGKKYIPGSKQGMYMITEKAYTPFIFDSKIDGKKAHEMRGKWEVKNDFMAGPFLNYSVEDKKNNRLIIVEGFTYAPSINKRDLVFELEAIAKSLKIK